ncbi:unnamed protein product [Arabidopsis thaliana]|uniref:Uncharacterized protein n=1 Tax=Arabidopsis thaliana TaxID=3702 RepID=A0A654E7N1_ARATH|nr:unnamed protein product [Arabidopsis thaliana]
MLGVTLTKVHSEKSKSRDRLVQKETKENAWGDRRFLHQDLKSSREKNRFRGIVDPDLESSRKVYRVRGFVDQEWKSSRKIYRVRGIVDQDEESSTGPRICRPGVEIVDQVRDFIDRVRGFVDQEWKSSRKIYRVRGIVDQDEESSTRICRPGVEIVDQVRDFIDRVRGFVDQVRDFIDRVQVFDFFLEPVSPQTFQCMLVPRGKRAIKLYRGGCV